MYMDRREKFIEKSNIRHNNKYDYSKVEYVNSTTKVTITCPEHGDFQQAPAAHARGDGCPFCANGKRGKRSDGDTFIKRAELVHEGKYRYDKVTYVNAMKKVTITCPEHGDFQQTPQAHLVGQGCPKCSGRGLSTDEIVKMFTNLHGDKYDYSKVVYTKMHDKVTIICPEHGEFMQTPSKHLLGQGCPECAVDKRAEMKNIGQEEFIRRCKELYGDQYDYSKTKYVNMFEKVTVICKKHGEFMQRANGHLNGHGCPRCGAIESRGETEIYEYICSLIGNENVEHSNRTVLDGHEIDIFIPSLNVGIEYNGLKWHSTEYRDNTYHLRKTKLAMEKGVRLIHVFEDEYIHKKEIVLSKIRRIIHADDNAPSVSARKCDVMEISKEDAETFINANHIQGYKGCTLAIGCKGKGSLIGAMTFKKVGNEWLLNRFATDNALRCNGVGGKIFSYFIRKYSPSSVKTFADLRWSSISEGSLYSILGFKVDGFVKPQYRYVDSSHPMERIHKLNFTRQLIEKRYNIDCGGKSADAVAQELGFYQIYDCGMVRYVWKPQ